MNLDDRFRNLRFNWTIGKMGGVPNIIPDESYVEADIRHTHRADLEGLIESRTASRIRRSCPSPRLGSSSVNE